MVKEVAVTGEAFVEDADEAAEDSIITEDHLHPPFTAIVPSGAFRRGAITMAGLPADTNTFTLGTTTITYTWKTSIAGSPGANNVWLKTQGTQLAACQLLNNAINGVTDGTNISYGSGTLPHPEIKSGVTVIKFSIGATGIAANANGSLYLREKTADVVEGGSPITLGQTGGWCTTTAFTRVYSTRYVMTGNAAALNDRVAGAYQMIEPMNWITDTDGNLVYWDPNLVIIENTSMSSATIIECDLFYSSDESTFTKMVEGLNLSFGSVGVGGAGSQQYLAPTSRVPPGCGLYIKLRSNGQTNTDTVDLKIEYHIYPYGV